MIEQLQKFLGKIAEFEIKHFYIMIVIFSIITALSIAGIYRIQFQSDLSKNNPKDIDIVKLDERINNKFSEKTDPILILVEIDDKTNLEKDIYDIRDPRVIKYIQELKKNLLNEPKIREVSAISDFFPYGIPNDLEGVKNYLSNIPEAGSIVNDKYTLTPVFVTTDLTGADEEKVRSLNNRINDIIDETGNPGGIKISVTGNAPLAASIFRLLINDSLYTLIAAAVLIFILLLILERSLYKALSIMIPLLFGVIWTVGAMGWFNIPISIGTAGLSAMLLGLGVEYSIFLFSRYNEERNNKSTEESIIIALSTTGASTLTSGLTTIIGFAVLMLSIFPILSDIGFTLALGISIILGAIMIVSPVVIIAEEKISGKLPPEDSLVIRTEKIFEKYGRLVVKRPIIFIIIPLLLTGLLYFGTYQIKSKDINFDNVLPADMPELIAFNKINDEFLGTNSAAIYIELDPSYSDSNEPTDIRDPRIIKYIDVLTQKTTGLSYFESVNSISNYEKSINNGNLPNTLEEQKLLLLDKDVSSLISKDYTAAIIRIYFYEESDKDRPLVEKEVKKIIEETEKPAGINVVGAGSIIIEEEFNRIIGPDSTKTAMYAFLIIIILLLVLTRSIKYTVLPLITVVLAIIWSLGLIGLFSIPFNAITSSVLSMTIGVGIDFGIQISMRYTYERKTKDKNMAMIDTLKNTLYPLSITLIAALIGFRAMTLGQLKIMGDLGNVISLGVLSAFIIAITIVSALIVILDRKKDNFHEKNYIDKNNINLKNHKNLGKKEEVKKTSQKRILRKNK